MRPFLAAAISVALGALSWSAPVSARTGAADTEIVYSVFDEDTGQSGVFRARADGSDVRSIVPMGGDLLALQPISPDGAFAVVADVDSVDLVELDGTGRKVLVPSTGSAVWSADSAKLLVTSGDLGEEVVSAVPIDGTDPQPLATGESLGGGSLGPVAWSSDGSVAVVAGWRPGGIQTHWRIPVDGTASEWPALVGLYPAPQGAATFAVEETEGGLSVVRLDHALANPAEWKVLPPGVVHGASWSRDGRLFTFAHTSATGDTTFWTLDATGGLVRRWADLPLEGTGLAYRALRQSPDGTMLSWYAATRTGQYQYEGVYVHDVTLGRTCQVLGVYDEMGADSIPFFSPDGSLLLVDNGSSVGVIPLETPGGSLKRLELGGLVDFAGFVPSGPPVVDAVPCARPEVERDVVVEGRRAGDGWRLAAYVFGAEPACVNEVPVKFQRRSSAGWRTLASRTTSTKHTAVMTVKRAGRYRALAPAVVRAASSCLRDVSAPVRLRR